MNKILFKQKRRQISSEECKFDLKDELPLLFEAFGHGASLFEQEVVQTPPEARIRGFEASLLNAKMVQTIQRYFPDNWKYGKYRRFVINVNGYVVLLKKLDKYDRPMNIKTKHSEAIGHQLQLSLFDDSNFNAESPILFFGYKKNKFGEISEPKLVYIDDNKAMWTLAENDLPSKKSIVLGEKSTSERKTVTIRQEVKKKRTS